MIHGRILTVVVLYDVVLHGGAPRDRLHVRIARHRSVGIQNIGHETNGLRCAGLRCAGLRCPAPLHSSVIMDLSREVRWKGNIAGKYPMILKLGSYLIPGGDPFSLYHFWAP